MANEVYGRAHRQRVDKDRRQDGASTNRKGNEDRDLRSLRHVLWHRILPYDSRINLSRYHLLTIIPEAAPAELVN